MAAMFPPCYRSLVINAGHGEATASAYWAYATSISLFAIALLAPVFGAVSDHTGGNKYYIAFFAGLGVLGTGLFVFLGNDTYPWGSLLFLLGDIGFAGSLVFYESLLPHIAKKDDIDQISTRGYALGYPGGRHLARHQCALVHEARVVPHAQHRLRPTSLFLLGGRLVSPVLNPVVAQRPGAAGSAPAAAVGLGGGRGLQAAGTHLHSDDSPQTASGLLGRLMAL